MDHTPAAKGLFTEPLDQERLVWTTSILTFLFGLVLYAVTMCRTVFWWDSGELAANASILGIPHRPGFPIYILLARVFGMPPLGSYFYRINFFSAFAAAAAVSVLTFAFLSLLLRHVDRGRAALYSAVLSVGAIVTTYTFWIQAVRTEVYALNILVVAIIILLLERVEATEQGNPRRRLRLLYAAAFLFGLGLGGHHATLASTAPALAVLTIVIVGRRVFRPGFLLAALAFLVLGLSVYLYLPLRAAQFPLLNWGWGGGSMADGAETVVATDAFSYLAQVTPEKVARNLYTAAILLADHVSRPLALLAVLGLFVWFTRAPRWGWFFVLLAAGNLFLVSVMATEFIDWNADLHGYLLPALVSLGFGLTGGFWLLRGYTFRLVDRLVRSGNLRLAAKTSLVGISMLLAVTPGVLGGPFCNLSDNRLAYDLGWETVDGLPQGAVLILDSVNWDFVLRGLQFAGGIRPDVVLLDRSLMPAPWYQQQCRRLYPELFAEVDFPRGTKVNAALEWADEIRATGRPVFWEFTERELPHVRRFEPAGHLFRLIDADSLLGDSVMFLQEDFERSSRFYGAVDQIRYDIDAQGMYIRNLYRAGLFYERRGLLDRARELYRRALAVRPDEGTLRAALQRVEQPQARSAEDDSR